MLTDAAQARMPVHGAPSLMRWISAATDSSRPDSARLSQHPEVTELHPGRAGSISPTRTPQRLAAALPPVVLPQLWRALAGELSRWRAGMGWNSRLRIGLVGSEPETALYPTQPRRFGRPTTGAPPPQALIDGTGDAELLALLFEMEVTMLRAEVAPPPNTRHLAVRTGKRYGKTSLTARHGRDLARAIAECR
jgi:hypothetical protein